MREGDGAAEVEAGSRERRVRPCSEREEPGSDSLFFFFSEVPGELGLFSLTLSILIMVKPPLNGFTISPLHLNRLTEIFELQSQRII